MKSYNKICVFAMGTLLVMFVAVNMVLLSWAGNKSSRPYRVEINRIAEKIRKDGLSHIELSEYQYVTNVEQCRIGKREFFEATDSDYLVREIEGELYRFDYMRMTAGEYANALTMVNIILGIFSLGIMGVLVFVRQKILRPFEVLRDVPYELSKGNLTVPIKENKSRFFGKFAWGMDMLRENIEQQKERELELQKEKKTLVLSVSHDIKTPLSAIKLYAKALSKGLYPETEKQREIAECINVKADEIEGFVSQIIKASNEDFLNLEAEPGEFYLSQLMGSVVAYYGEKLKLVKTEFTVGAYSDCILKGDINRSIEVLQNIIENAIKYGDGGHICIAFSEEEDCQLVTVKNSGCTLQEAELPHIFESFWRGSNTGSNKGSGLGLYICRQLMHKMDGDVFAQIRGDEMCVTAVYRKAV